MPKNMPIEENFESGQVASPSPYALKKVIENDINSEIYQIKVQNFLLNEENLIKKIEQRGDDYKHDKDEAEKLKKLFGMYSEESKVKFAKLAAEAAAYNQSHGIFSIGDHVHSHHHHFRKAVEGLLGKNFSGDELEKMLHLILSMEDIEDFKEIQAIESEAYETIMSQSSMPQLTPTPKPKPKKEMSEEELSAVDKCKESYNAALNGSSCKLHTFITHLNELFELNSNLTKEGYGKVLEAIYQQEINHACQHTLVK